MGFHKISFTVIFRTRCARSCEIGRLVTMETLSGPQDTSEYAFDLWFLLVKEYTEPKS